MQEVQHGRKILTIQTGNKLSNTLLVNPAFAFMSDMGIRLMGYLNELYNNNFVKIYC